MYYTPIIQILYYVAEETVFKMYYNSVRDYDVTYANLLYITR